MDLKQRGCKDVECTDLDQVRAQWFVRVNVVMTGRYEIFTAM
jgi:hypothetical protein